MSNPNESPSLRGKTIAVLMRDRPTTVPIVLRDCMLETRGGRMFLAGTSLPAHQGALEWTDGARRAIAWDAVDEYLLFQSPEDYYSREQPALVQNAGQPIQEYPQSADGTPVEPSGISVEPETPLEIGSVVLSYSQGRWWRAEVVDLEGDDDVLIHFPGWESKWDVTVPRCELQIYLGDSIESDDHS